MCTLVLVLKLLRRSKPAHKLVWLRLLTVPTLPWTYLATKLRVGKRRVRVSVDALVNLKTTSCQQLLYYDFILAALCSTDNLPRKSKAHCYTKHDKIVLLIQCAVNRYNSKDADQPARPLRIRSFFPILCTGWM